MIPRTVLTRPFNKITVANNSNFTKNVNTVKGTSVNIARPKVVLSAVNGNKGNVVKASACWIMKKLMEDLLPWSNSKKRENLMEKGKIRTGKLDFEDVKFDRKADEGFFVGYSTNSKAFRVFNSRTRIVKENLHVQFSENTPNIAGSGLNYLFDIDALTKSMNYKPVVAGNQSNSNAGTKACNDAGRRKRRMLKIQGIKIVRTNTINTVSLTVNAASIEVNAVDPKSSIELPYDLNMLELEDFLFCMMMSVGAEAKS
ncbi:hypothetical protein Tco_0863203 [Tanacetum coccineum]